jgi:hypothetical protein
MTRSARYLLPTTVAAVEGVERPKHALQALYPEQTMACFELVFQRNLFDKIVGGPPDFCYLIFANIYVIRP